MSAHEDATCSCPVTRIEDHTGRVTLVTKHVPAPELERALVAEAVRVVVEHYPVGDWYGEGSEVVACLISYTQAPGPTTRIELAEALDRL